MAYAKLSGALLACKELPAPPTLQSLAPPGIALAPPPGEPAALLADCLKALKLPAFLREHDELARECAAEGLDHSLFLLRLARRELEERQRRRAERLIRLARFPALKSLEDFDFAAIPSLDRGMVLDLAGCDYVARCENVIAVGSLGTGKTHLAIGLGLAACRKGFSVAFTTAASLIHELVEARAERRLVRLERRLDAAQLLIVDELGYAPLLDGGAELFFEIISRRCERGSIIITSDQPIGEWVGLFGSERLTGALLDRLSWRLHVLEMNGESYRLEHGARRPASAEDAGAGEASFPRISAVAQFARGMMRFAADREPG